MPTRNWQRSNCLEVLQSGFRRDVETDNLIPRRIGELVLSFALSVCATKVFADFPDAMVDWMQGPPILNGKPTYTAVHAESRIKGFDPQLLQKGGSVSEATPWQPVVPNVQPFSSMVDRESNKVYWRKDFFDSCEAKAPCDFYGEVFSFNEQFVHLRMESFPVFGGSIDDGKTWDIRIDKFRLISNSSQGRDYFPNGLGRIWAPAHISSGWKTSQIIDTLACLSFDAFTHGTCQMYQKSFVEDSVSVELWSNFSTVFDGEAVGYAADPEYKSFDRAVVITQIMGHGKARERFFLAGKIDKSTGAFQSYGFVRWDDSVKDSTGHFITIARTVGLRRASDKQVTFAGMRTRGAEDSFKGAAGLRILHDDGAAYPNGDQTKSCPDTLMSVGSVHEPSATHGAGEPEQKDLSGFTSSAGGWIGVCFSPNKTNVTFTLPAGCPAQQQRGSLFVEEANVKKTMTDTGADLIHVIHNWVALCATAQGDWHAYFSLASKGCDTGGFKVGSVREYKDCYDAKGRRCEGSAQSASMILCTTK
jgi:hypothetical protein